MIDLVAQHQTIAKDVMQAVEAVFQSQAFVLGEAVANFEESVAQYCDARHAIGCASGTDALILALMALDIGPGAEVITSPFTFFATASSIARVGARPVFVDIDPVSFNMDPSLVEKAITPRTKAIMPVHLFGQCVEMDPLWRIATKHGIPIVEDACQAIGAEYQGRRAGVLGRIACFSFFPTKNLGGAGDGGLVTTDDADLAKRIKHLRVHGDVGRYEHIEVGLNSRLDALQAAILSVKLRSLDKWSVSRERNAHRYQELFTNAGLLDAVMLPKELPHRRHIYNQYCIRVKAGKRNQVLASLQQQKIGAAIYYPKPLHIQTCFAPLGYKPGDFPESERASAEILALPIYAELTAAQQETVVRGIAYGLGRSLPVQSLYSASSSPVQGTWKRVA
jgi:dTDP-4-amino-4,6-dideoxygalactose transaminase